MLSLIDIEEFDHVFLFYDHGFKFTHEIRMTEPYRILDEDRTNVLFLHKQKGQKQITVNDTLCSLIDFKSLCVDILNENLNGKENYTLPEREHIIIEDHSTFNVNITTPIDLWAVKTRSSYYIRNLESGFHKSSNMSKYKSETSSKFDAILLKNLEFKSLMNIKRLQKYYKILKKDYPEASEIYDYRKSKINPFISGFHKINDIIKHLFGKI